MNRDQRLAVAQESVQIMQRGSYTLPNGAEVSIADELSAACFGTQLFRPRDLLESATGTHHTVWSAINETTLRAAHRLHRAHGRVLALNFASAKNPGGGFLSGSSAQEESLARASGLYACINGSPYYEFHRKQRSPLYSDHMIYSPDVPVFRDDEGNLLQEPWLCSFVTSPAVNRGVLMQQAPELADQVLPVMRERVRRVLSIASTKGYQALVLGAWGCGVFKNEPEEIAQLFDEALRGPFQGRFAQVCFAVLDKPNGRSIRAFEELLR